MWRPCQAWRAGRRCSTLLEVVSERSHDHKRRRQGGEEEEEEEKEELSILGEEEGVVQVPLEGHFKYDPTV